MEINLAIFILLLGICCTIPIIIITVEQIIENIKMRKIYKTQKYRINDFKNVCPKCGSMLIPFPRIVAEGIQFSLVRKKYIEIPVTCFHCEFNVDVVAKWNGFCSSAGLE